MPKPQMETTKPDHIPPSPQVPGDDASVMRLATCLSEDVAVARAALAILLANPDAPGADVVFERLHKKLGDMGALDRALDVFRNHGFTAAVV